MAEIFAIFDEALALILQGPALLYIGAGLVGLLASMRAVGFLRGGVKSEPEDQKVGRLRSKIFEVQALIDNPTRHATIVDRQNIFFSLFTLISGAAFVAVEAGMIDGFEPWGVSGRWLVFALAITTSVLAAATLATKWVWSSPFMNFEEWKAKQDRKIDALIRRAAPKRETLKISDAQRQALEAELDHDELAIEQEAEVAASAAASSEAIGMPAPRTEVVKPPSDQFVNFLHSRKDVRLVLAPKIDDGHGDRPWRIGTVERVGDAGFGFLRERVPSADDKSVSMEGEKFYFSFSNICNGVQPEEGDEVFFIAVDGARLSESHKRPAYLVCLRDKPCRAIVRTAFTSGKRGFVEITDGSDNFASVLASFDQAMQERDEPLKDGDLVSGIVSHNNQGLTIKQAKPVT